MCVTVSTIRYQQGWRFFEEIHLAESIMLMQQAESFGFPVVALMATHSEVPVGEKEPEPRYLIFPLS